MAFFSDEPWVWFFYCGDDSLPNRQMMMGFCCGNYIRFVSCTSVVVGDECFYFQTASRSRSSIMNADFWFCVLVMLDAFRLCIWRQRSGRLSAIEPSALFREWKHVWAVTIMKNKATTQQTRLFSLFVRDYFIYVYLLSVPLLSLYSCQVTRNRSCALLIWMHWHRHCNQPYWIRIRPR